MATPRAKWWTARSTLHEEADLASIGAFKNACDLLSEAYWSGRAEPHELRSVSLAVHDVARIVDSHSAASRTVAKLARLAQEWSRWHDVGSILVTARKHGNVTRGCILEWPNAPEYLGLDFRQSGRPPAPPPAPSGSGSVPVPVPLSDQRTDASKRSGLKTEPERPWPELPSDSVMSTRLWMKDKGQRVGDGVVRALYENDFRAGWATADAGPPRNPGGAFMQWVKNEHAAGRLDAAVQRHGGSSIGAEVGELLRELDESGAAV